MEPLDRALAELIATETETVAPPQGAKAKAWAAIGAGLGAPVGGPVPGSGEAAPATAAKTGAWLKVVGATAIVGAVGAGVWATSGGPADPAPTTAVAKAEPEEQPAPAVVAAPESTPEAEPEPEPEPVPEQEPEPAPDIETPSAKIPKPRPPRGAGTPALGLADELALVEKIRKAVAAGKHGEALKLAAEHRDEFPKGSLRPDRLDLEATAHCGRGQLERGRKLADLLRERWPKSPVSDRLESTCKLD